MKLLTVEYPEQDVCQLTLTATAQELEEGAAAIYERTRETYTIKGFEKGQADRAEIEADRGEHVFWYDAINDIMDRDVPAIYASTVEEMKFNVVNEPAYDLVSVKKDEGFTATVTFCLMPELTIGDYKNIVVKCAPVPVEEREVEHFIERKRNLAAKLVPHKGPAVKGNVVHIDYVGFVENKAFQGGTAENQTVQLGTGRMIPGFEEAIIGHEAGDSFDIEVTFPVNYQNKELAGKPAVFKAKLIDACMREIPALNADFAKEVGKVDTMEEYRAQVREQLEKMKHDNAMNRAKGDIMTELSKLIEGNVAEMMITQSYTQELQQIQQMLQMQRTSMAQFLQQIKKTKEEFTEEVKAKAVDKVRVSLALLDIAKAEGLTLTDDELNEEITKRAERAKKPVEEYVKNIDKELVRQGLSRARAAEFVVEKATIEE